MRGIFHIPVRLIKNGQEISYTPVSVLLAYITELASLNIILFFAPSVLGR